MIPLIIYEEERKEDMAADLRVGFKERQCKHLSESITIIHLPIKKPYTKILCPVPISTIAPILETSTAATGISHVPDKKLSVGKYAHSKLGGPFTSPAQLSDGFVECVASVPPHPQAPLASSREEMVERLK